MRYLLSFLFLILIIHGAVFVPETYFYENETPTVDYEKWVVDNTTYYVYYFDGKPTFLVENGTPIADNNTIYYVVEKYYREKYPIDETSLNMVAQLLLDFNESRFDNDNLYRMEEQRCREQLGERAIKAIPKRSLEKMLNSPYFNGDIYKLYAALLVSNDLVPPGYSEEYIADQVRFYFTNSDALSDAIARAYRLVLEMEQEPGVEEKAQQLHGLVEEIEERTYNLETARVLGLRNTSLCGDPNTEGCLYLCPPPNYDHEALSQLKTLVKGIRDVALDYAQWKEVAQSIAEETENRLFYVFATQETERIRSALNPLDKEWREEKRKITDLLLYVRDGALIDYVNEIDGLRDDIEEKLQEQNFTNLTEDVERLSTLIDKAETRYLSVKELYDETLKYREMANVLIRLIDNKDKVQDIISVKMELDRNFVYPIPYTSLKTFNARYKEVVEALKDYYVREEKGSEDPFLGVKKFIGGAANGFYTLVKGLNISVPVKALSLYTTALISLSMFFLTTFLGVIGYVKFYKRLSRRKYLYFTVVAVLGLIASGVSAISYLPIHQLTHIDNPLIFAEHVEKYDNITLMVKLGSSFDDVIEDCALKTRRELEAMGLDVHYWRVIGEQCYKDGRPYTLRECTPTSPYIVYAPGSPRVEGSVVGEAYLVVEGNKETFKKCSLRHYLALLNEIRGER